MTYLTQHVLDLGFIGLAYATNCTRAITLLIYFIYFKYMADGPYHKDQIIFKKIWLPLGKDTLGNIGAFS